MKILVLSDSHGDTADMVRVVARHKDEVACIAFLGDYAKDVDTFAARFGKPVAAVAGNCDWTSKYPRDLVLDAAGKQIWMCHGDAFGVKSNYNKITSAAAARRADICLFGHTHEAVTFERNGILFMNPGSISEPRGRTGRSYGIITIESGVCRGSIFLAADF